MESDKFGGGSGQSLNYFAGAGGKGYAVLRPNYRGSTGYGNAFYRDVVDNYFHNMATDVMAGVDALIAQGHRRSRSAGLHGMERRRHAGQQAGDDDRSLQGGVVGRRHRELDLDATRKPTTRRSARRGSAARRGRRTRRIDLFWNSSPLKDVANVKTPTLFFVGDGDTRVPMAQSVEMYRALEEPRRADAPARRAERRAQLGRAAASDLRKANTELEWFEKYANGRTYVRENRTPGSLGLDKIADSAIDSACF